MGFRSDLLQKLSGALLGQDDALDSIAECVVMAASGMAPFFRPLGVFALIGPTGTGKTHTVEVLAEALHGCSGNHLRIDCAEFQLDHEIAKLIGSPPGYLGHRETQAAISTDRLNAVKSSKSDISILLFDEIEKAAPAVARLLLGVLDRGVLTLGDNRQVNLSQTIIFMTSNIGEAKTLKSSHGFVQMVKSSADKAAASTRAFRRHFSPEFINRIDRIIAYRQLSLTTVRQILEMEIEEISKRLSYRSISLQVSEAAKDFMMLHGYSEQYGAREIKRSVNKYLTVPLAEMIVDGDCLGFIRADMEDGNDSAIAFRVSSPPDYAVVCAAGL